MQERGAKHPRRGRAGKNGKRRSEVLSNQAPQVVKELATDGVNAHFVLFLPTFGFFLAVIGHF